MRLENAPRFLAGAFLARSPVAASGPQFATFEANGSRSRLVGCVGPPMRQMAEGAEFERELIRERRPAKDGSGRWPQASRPGCSVEVHKRRKAAEPLFPDRLG